MLSTADRSSKYNHGPTLLADRFNASQPLGSNLINLAVVSTLLSYYGHEDEVREILLRLSHGSRTYWKQYKEILKCFVVSWRLTYLLDFGCPSAEWNEIFPSLEQFKYMPKHKALKLDKINYRQEADVGSLCAI